MTIKKFKFLTLSIIAASLISCSENNTNKEPVSKSSSPIVNNDSNSKSNINYIIGYKIGSSLSQDSNLKNYNLQNDKIIDGFKDAVNSKDPAISQKSIDNNMQQLRNTIMKSVNANILSNFLKIKDNLHNSDLTPKLNIKNPAVVIYDFFDYQCMYCPKTALEIEKVIRNRADTQIVFVEFPLFGQTDSTSKYAAEVGTAIYKLYGVDIYLKYNKNIFSITTKDKLNKSTIDKIAKNSGANINAIQKAIKDNKIADHLNNTLKIGLEDIGVQGTPFLIIAPAKNASIKNTIIVNGYMNYSDIQVAIKKAKI